MNYFERGSKPYFGSQYERYFLVHRTHCSAGKFAFVSSFGRLLFSAQQFLHGSYASYSSYSKYELSLHDID